MSLLPDWNQQPWLWGTGLALVLLIVVYIHFSIRKRVARSMTTKLRREMKGNEYLENFIKAFGHNTRAYRSVFQNEPLGWNQRTQNMLQKVLADTGSFIQTLNDAFANPSGRRPH
jgi:hypothetical protein